MRIDWKLSITLETTLISRSYYAIEGEREREKEFLLFALLMAQNASNEKLGKKPGGKKSKVPFSIRNGGEKLKQVVFPMFLCYLHRLAHIDTYNSESMLRYGVLVDFFNI